MAESKSVFRWTDECKVNIAVLDQQHRDLLDILNELERALRVGEGNSVTERILDRLITYAGSHFDAEESLMERYQFPGLATHRIQHDMFRGRMKGFLERHRAAKPGLPVELMLFLHTWLKSHLMKTDKQYSVFLNARGVR